MCFPQMHELWKRKILARCRTKVGNEAVVGLFPQQIPWMCQVPPGSAPKGKVKEAGRVGFATSGVLIQELIVCGAGDRDGLQVWGQGSGQEHPNPQRMEG